MIASVLRVKRSQIGGCAEMTGKKPTKPPAEAGATLEFAVQDDEYAAAVRSQKDALERIACKIEAGDSLSRLEVVMVGQCLRRQAERMSEVQPKPPGRPKDFDHAGVSLFYWRAVRAGDKSVTQQGLAEKWGVTDEAMGRALRRNQKAAEQFLDAIGETRTNSEE